MDANGNVERTVSVYDDGREVEFLYENGVRASRLVQDTDDNFDWVRHSTPYDDLENQTGRVTECDNGIVESTYMTSDGNLSMRVLVDTADVEDWYEIIFQYDPSGQPSRRVTQNDDGTEDIEPFGLLPL